MKNMVIASYGKSDDGEGNPTRIWYPNIKIKFYVPLLWKHR